MRQRSIIKYVIIALLIGLTIFVASYKTYKRQRLPLYSTGLKHLPRKVQQSIRTTPLPKHVSLLIIKHSACDTYSNFSGTHWQDKLDSVLQTVTRIQQSADPIPDGYYLLALEDGVHAEHSLPLLAFASDQQLVAHNKVVLLPDFDAHRGYAQLLGAIRSAAQKHPWSQKQAAIFWRGGANGPLRVQFMRDIANKYPFIDAGFIGYGTKEHKKLRAYAEKHFALTTPVSPEESLPYKYLLDLDGYSCSYSRMAWILSSNSLLVKHISNKTQWYYPKLRAYEHYLPISANFDNLQQQFAWAEDNPDQVQQMIGNAQKLAAEIFTQAAIDESTRTAFTRYYSLTQS